MCSAAGRACPCDHPVVPTGPPPARVAWVAVAVHLVLAAGILLSFGRDPAALVAFYGPDEPDCPSCALVYERATDERGRPPERRGPAGHDGAQFWVLAHDPLLLDDATFDQLDRPSYRARRVLYPLLAAPAGLVSAELRYWALLAVNLAAVAGGTWAAAVLARTLGATTWAGLWFGLSPVAVFSTMFDLADALSLGLLIATVLALRRDRWGVATAAATAAVLAKEPALLAVVALAAWPHGLPTATVARRVRLIAVPALVAAAWIGYATLRAAAEGSGTGELVGLPFSAYWTTATEAWIPFGTWGDAAAGLSTLVLAGAVAARWWRRRTPELTMCLPYAAMAPFLSEGVIFRDENSLRALGPALTMLGLDVAAERATRRRATDPRATSAG